MEKILAIVIIVFFAICLFGIGYEFSRLRLTKRMMDILDSVKYEEHSNDFIRGVLYVSKRLHDL